MQTLFIPKGSLLFRYAPNICDLWGLKSLKREARFDPDTGKTGLYFGTKALTSIAIAVEYNNVSLDLGVFQTQEDIEVLIGKYAYRDIHPERFQHSLNVKLLPDENISHFESLLLLDEGEKAWLLPKSIQQQYEDQSGGEIFLTPGDLMKSKIQLIGMFKINPSIRNGRGLKVILNQLGYPFDFDSYIQSRIIYPERCKRSVTRYVKSLV